MFLLRNAPIVPEKGKVWICSLCVEPGAIKRKCCNGLYCDHCYSKNQKCPNCSAGTRIEKVTGAVYQLKVCSEHEECRACLEPGIQRRCCNSYYCDSCYYSVPNCRFCGAQLSDPKKSIFSDKAFLTTTLLSYFITIFLVISVAAFFSVVVANEISTPVGLSSYSCYGFFRTCDLPGIF